ncbi:hypothetical protein ACA910_003705 [Epithemia clementina (nom. ined.)]
MNASTHFWPNNDDHDYYNHNNNNSDVEFWHRCWDTSNRDGSIRLDDLWNWTLCWQQQLQVQQQHWVGQEQDKEFTFYSSWWSLIMSWMTHLAQEWPLLDWKLGIFVWRSLFGSVFGGVGGLSLGLYCWAASIWPGRLHAWSSRIWKWPVLVLTLLLIAVELIVYIAVRLVVRLAETLIATPKHEHLRRQMAQAQSYSEWYDYAAQLDQSQQRHLWLQNDNNSNNDNNNDHDNGLSPPKSSLPSLASTYKDSAHNYNWRLITDLMHELQSAREEETTLSRSNLHRALAVLQQCTRGPNVGGIMSPDLFCYSNTGEPKRLVKDFIQQVIETVYWITDQTRQQQQPTNSDYHHADPNDKDDDDDNDDETHGPTRLSFHSRNTTSHFPSPPTSSRSDQQLQQQQQQQLVLAVLQRARASYGRTALCLSGGAMMGLYHFGIVLGLAQQGLLPRIISGTSAGSVVAALLCTRTNAELQHLLTPEQVTPHLNSFDRSWKERLVSLYRTGSMFDANEWETKIKWFTNGDMTFEEAYRRTGRIFCITLSSTSKKAPSRLINYRSAPNVTIASAVLASSAVPGFVPPVRLRYKDAHGVIREYRQQHDQTYCDGSIRQDIPIASLAEALNCQFFIASQCNPHVVPFFFHPKGGVGRPCRWSSGAQEHSWRGGFLLAALEMYLKTDMKSKFVFLKDLDAAVGFTSTMMTQDFVGSTTIVPQVSFRDYFKLFSDPTVQDLKRYFQAGEVAAYEHAELIKLHFSISDALEDCIAKLEGSSRCGNHTGITSLHGQSSQRDGIHGHVPPPQRRQERCASYVDYSTHGSKNDDDYLYQPRGRSAPSASTLDWNGEPPTHAPTTTRSNRRRSSLANRQPSAPVVQRLEQLVTQAIKVQQTTGDKRQQQQGGAIAFGSLLRNVHRRHGRGRRSVSLEPRMPRPQQLHHSHNDTTTPETSIGSCNSHGSEDSHDSNRQYHNRTEGLLVDAGDACCSSSSPRCTSPDDEPIVELEQLITEAITVKKFNNGALAFGTLRFDDEDDFEPIYPC